MGKGLRLSGREGQIGLSLPRGGDGWVGLEQLGGFGGPVLPCIPFFNTCHTRIKIAGVWGKDSRARPSNSFIFFKEKLLFARCNQ